MKKYTLLFFFIFIFSFLLYFTLALSDASECHSGYIGSECCDNKVTSNCVYCVEDIDWGYCNVNTGTECANPRTTNCTEFWSSQCCCNGTTNLTCVPIPDVELDDIRMWGDPNCERLNATIDCDGIPGNHYVCNSTYYPTDPKCARMEPTISGYSVSSKNIILNENFSISVFGTCPNGLLGRCLIECRVVHPDGYKIEIDSWDGDGSATLPNITCNKVGNYIVDYCQVFTDFIINGGWGNYNDTNTTITCRPTSEFVPPTYSYDNDTSGGSVNEGEPVIASTLWSDNKGLSSAKTIHNETSNWVSTSTSLSGTSQWYNYTLSTSGYKGKTICWYQNATDTSGNSNNNMKNNIHCFNVITSTTTTEESVFESFRKSVSASISEISTNFLTLAFQFLGIIVLIIILILVVQQIIQSHG